ncbi:substrate-binding domain-containing protein [Variovorax sp. GB1P17]|uniref:substrate-binding domain-containing protein n=1 Tax=Variovorax sp. GB1P17 TaxID=3443740 RepID=UPI003F46B502
MNAKFKTVALSAVMMAGLMAAGAVSAQTAVGGGATLPEILYDEILPSGVGLTDFSYTGTGSGAGKSAFLNNSATAFKDESQDPAPAWSAAQSVHFAGSDSALTSTELTNYNNAHKAAWGPLIQVPAVATAVLIPYKRAAVTTLPLTDAKMCAIYSNKTGGQTWGQVRGVVDTTTVKVVYRSDTSGTTELLSRYLVAACPTSGFKVSNSFATVVGNALPGATSTTAVAPPAHWVAVSGSSGVSGAMGATGSDGRLGYLSPEPGYTGGSAAIVATINGSLPDAASIQSALAAQPLPVGGASAASDPLAWVPAYSKPPVTNGTSKYPIFGTTNLLVNQCYKDSVVQGRIVALLTGLFGTTYDSQITAHNFVNLPTTGSTNDWKTALVNTFLTSSSSLAIGNTNVCNGIGRPLSN